MSQLNVIAHPYAQALFNLAKAKQQESAWLQVLADLQVIAANPDFVDMLNNPKVDHEQIIAVVKALLKDEASSEVLNLLQILAENNRFKALGEIYTIYRELVLNDQKRCDALIESAYAMSPEETHSFEQLLSKKFGVTVTATVKVNPELMAGIKVTINDKVIDGSVKGRLSDLATQLTK